ncbi:hypothetical protein M0802_007076 [Mischocyttarus mexicanus]|nr:hypothetical protein M0802_007076 [Mischocyttarus mexicanus]
MLSTFQLIVSTRNTRTQTKVLLYFWTFKTQDQRQQQQQQLQQPETSKITMETSGLPVPAYHFITPDHIVKSPIH